MHLRLWLSVAIGLLVLLAAPVACLASVGVGVQAGPVRLTGVAHPGGKYALPPVYVVNTGTQDEAIAIRIERISGGAGRTVPPSWIQVSAPPARLSHGQSARIPLELAVPAGATPGEYFSDVVVKGSAALAVGGANLGVAAATDLEFMVAPGAAAQPWFSVPAWVLVAAAGIVLLTVAVAIVRRSGIRIKIERESAGADPVASGGGGNAV